MATSGDSDDKILLFNKKRTPWFQSDAPLKKYAHKNISYKEKVLINKVKGFTGNNDRQVWSDRKLLFWFTKDQHWVEIK